MKSTTILFQLTLILFCFPGLLAAQNGNQRTVIPAKRVTVYLEVAGDPGALPADLESEEAVRNYIDQQDFNAKVMVEFFTLARIKKVHVKLGTTPGQSDMGEHTFEVQGNPRSQAEPYTYNRKGKLAVMGMGTVRGAQNLHAEVVLEDNQGNRSEPRYYSPFVEGEE